MDRGDFIGRRLERAAVLDELGRAGMAVPGRKLICVHGEAEIGKKRFLDQIWNDLSQSFKPRMALRIESDWASNATDISDYLTTCLQASTAALQQRIDQFKSALEFQKAQTQEIAPSLLQALTQWCQLWVRQCFPASDPPCQILILLPDFDRLSPDLKHPLLRILAEQVEAGIPHGNVRYLISAERPETILPEMENLAPHLAESCMQVALGPVAFEEVESWVRDAGIANAHKFTRRLMEATAGQPADLYPTAQEMQQQAAQAAGSALAERLMRQLQASEQKALCLAAYFDTFDTHAMQMFMPVGQAQDAVFFLRHDGRIPVAGGHGAWHLEANLRSGVQAWCEQYQPEAHAEYSSQTARYNKLGEFLPAGEARLHLLKLARFNYFTPEVLKEVYPRDAEALSAFASHCPQFFERKVINQRLRPEVADTLAEFRKLVGLEDDPALTDRINRNWQRRREEILHALERSKAEQSKQEEALRKAQSAVKSVQKDLMSEQTRLNRLQTPSQKKTRHPSYAALLRRHIIISILIQFFGTSMLYFGILFSDTISISYAVVGILAIMFGLYQQSRKPTMPAQHLATATVSLDHTAIAGYERSVQLLQLKRSQQEQKVNSLSRAITDAKAHQRELDALIHEPYA